MGKHITFTGKNAWDATTNSMEFQVKIDGARTRCLISREALEDHFGADREKTVDQAFNDNRSEIERVATNIINKGLVNASGEYLIRSSNI
ncbi:DUF1488 domain-containing protein [Halioxenophilus aromaticivorans]|uniref:DUF1488 domain-containing protein n=1 Tax=Halioxenophilus aromaticivorans TaxID=1306992 RepID=A0AAV3U4T7_9ALTE